MPRLPAQLKQFCDHEKVMRLAYIDGDGFPRVMPVWFVKIGNDFVVGTEDTSTKWQFIQKNPKVGWVIDGGTNVKNYKGVSFWGAAEQVADQRLHRRAFNAFGVKYFGSAQSPAFLKLFGEPGEPGTVFIRLRPERFFFWDYSR